jgi:hypothetical protein
MSVGSATVDHNFLELNEDGCLGTEVDKADDSQTPILTGHGHASEMPIPASATPINKVIGLWEIALFAIICTADMLSTVYWYTHGQALEANPVLAFWLNKSVTAFCIAKLATFGPLLIACAIYRERYARVITPGLRIAMMTYVVVYACAIFAQLVK